MKRVIGAVLAVLAAAAVLVGIDAAPASASSSGCGYGCDGRDPYTYRIWLNPRIPDDYVYCSDDAQRIYTTSLDGYPAALWYSPFCQTAWARTTSSAASNGYQIEVDSYTTSSGGSLRIPAELGAWGNGSYEWTNMVNDAGLYARACISSGDNHLACTARY